MSPIRIEREFRSRWYREKPILEVVLTMSSDERLQILRTAKPNSWIAFSADEERVIAVGLTFEDAIGAAKESGESDPLLTFIPPNWAPALL